MERYYKISRTSETGKKVQDVLDRKERFRKAAELFYGSYLIHSHLHNRLLLAGMQAVRFMGEPDLRLWKRVRKDEFKPRARSIDKEDKEIIEKLKRLNAKWKELQELSVCRYDLDELVGGPDPFFQCGWNFTNPEYFIFITEEEYNVPSDATEISNIEFREIINKQHG